MNSKHSPLTSTESEDAVSFKLENRVEVRGKAKMLGEGGSRSSVSIREFKTPS